MECDEGGRGRVRCAAAEDDWAIKSTRPDAGPSDLDDYASRVCVSARTSSRWAGMKSKSTVKSMGKVETSMGWRGK
jgi:hypothetical protein